MYERRDSIEVSPTACSKEKHAARRSSSPYEESIKSEPGVRILLGRFILSEEVGVNNFGAAEVNWPGEDGNGMVMGGIEAFVRRTPVLPSTMPSCVAARMKYCMVVPVLLVLFAFRAVRVSFKFCGTNLQ